MFEDGEITLDDARECGQILRRCPVHDRMKSVYNDERLPGEHYTKDTVPRERANKFAKSMSRLQQRLGATATDSSLDTLFNGNTFWKSIEITAQVHDPFMLASPGKRARVDEQKIRTADVAVRCMTCICQWLYYGVGAVEEYTHQVRRQRRPGDGTPPMPKFTCTRSLEEDTLIFKATHVNQPIMVMARQSDFPSTGDAERNDRIVEL